MLVGLAYPELNRDDREAIVEFRRLHDQAFFDVVNEHWTLIFPISGVSKEDLSRHIVQVVSRHAPIDFVIRYAIVHDDDFSDNYYIFLVPDEGFSAISRLHNDLASGVLQRFRRIDLPYVPHIAVATSKDVWHLKQLVGNWNEAKRDISGRIKEITLSDYDGKKVRDLQTFKLGAS
jgi:2'-5' RNA ligase